MTVEEQRLVDDKMRAEIAALIESATESRAKVDKMSIEIDKIRAETRQIGLATVLQPLIAGAALAGAIAALAKIFLV